MKKQSTNGKKEKKRVRFPYEDDPRSVMATQARSSLENEPEKREAPSSRRGGAASAYKTAVAKHAQAVEHAAEQAKRAECAKIDLYEAYKAEFVAEHPIVFLVVETGRPKTTEAGSKSRSCLPPMVWGIYTTADAALAVIVNRPERMTKSRYKFIVPVAGTYVLKDDLLRDLPPDTVCTYTAHTFRPAEEYAPLSVAIDVD